MKRLYEDARGLYARKCVRCLASWTATQNACHHCGYIGSFKEYLGFWDDGSLTSRAPEINLEDLRSELLARLLPPAPRDLSRCEWCSLPALDQERCCRRCGQEMPTARAIWELTITGLPVPLSDDELPF